MVEQNIPCEYGGEHTLQPDIAGIAAGCRKAGAVDMLPGNETEKIT